MGVQVGEVIMTMWTQCGSGNFTKAQEVIAKEQTVRGQQHGLMVT